MVENFTIGREGFGSIFFPGMTDVTGLNLDEIGDVLNDLSMTAFHHM